MIARETIKDGEDEFTITRYYAPYHDKTIYGEGQESGVIVRIQLKNKHIDCRDELYDEKKEMLMHMLREAIKKDTHILVL